MDRHEGEPRSLSRAFFGNASFAEVVRATDKILTAAGAGATVTTRQVAAATGHADSVVRPIMARLFAGGLLEAVPKMGPANGPQLYTRRRQERWDATLALAADFQDLPLDLSAR